MADKYTFGDIIGHGNYGTCFLVTHVSENRLYVAKRVPVIDVAARGEALAEAQLLSKIKHPNVIAYKESFLSTDDAGGDGDGDDDYGRNGNNRKKQKQKTRYGGDPATLCIVTAYAEEGDLFTHIKRARESRPRRYFPERQVLDWTAQIALALDHIHGMRVMHRDLKTQNIFLGRGTAVGLFRALCGVQSGSHYHYNTCNIVQHCLPTVRIAQHATRDLLTFFVSNPRRSGETGRFWYFPGVGTNRRLRHHRGGDAVLPEPGSVPEHAVHPEIGRVEFRVCDFRDLFPATRLRRGLAVILGVPDRQRHV
jgi:serine/threonine protein kinase